MRQFCLLLMLLVTSGLTAAEDFRISDIRVDGLLRLSEGSIFSYVPLEVGDTMTPALARSTIRDLWATGFFDDVTLEREGNVLVVQVEERPAISGISITGNRQIKDRKSTRLNSSHVAISYALFCLKKKTYHTQTTT